MRVGGDQKADANYLTLADRKVEASEEPTEGIIIDYDVDGPLVGIDILDAAERPADPSVLQQFSFELPGVA